MPDKQRNVQAEVVQPGTRDRTGMLRNGGNHHTNIYRVNHATDDFRKDEHVGVMFTPELGRTVVAAVNTWVSSQPETLPEWERLRLQQQDDQLVEQIAEALSNVNTTPIDGEDLVIRPFSAKSERARTFATAALSVVIPLLDAKDAEITWLKAEVAERLAGIRQLDDLRMKEIGALRGELRIEESNVEHVEQQRDLLLWLHAEAMHWLNAERNWHVETIAERDAVKAHNDALIALNTAEHAYHDTDLADRCPGLPDDWREQIRGNTAPIVTKMIKSWSGRPPAQEATPDGLPCGHGANHADHHEVCQICLADALEDEEAGEPPEIGEPLCVLDESNDMEAFAALSECQACEGTGKDVPADFGGGEAGEPPAPRVWADPLGDQWLELEDGTLQQGTTVSTRSKVEHLFGPLTEVLEDGGTDG